jgi:hypothetical protein
MATMIACGIRTIAYIIRNVGYTIFVLFRLAGVRVKRPRRTVPKGTDNQPAENYLSKHAKLF